MLFTLEQWAMLAAIPVIVLAANRLIAAPFLALQRRKLAETGRRCAEFDQWLDAQKVEEDFVAAEKD